MSGKYLWCAWELSGIFLGYILGISNTPGISEEEKTLNGTEGENSIIVQNVKTFEGSRM